jgi:hypothetical protein
VGEGALSQFRLILAVGFLAVGVAKVGHYAGLF